MLIVVILIRKKRCTLESINCNLNLRCVTKSLLSLSQLFSDIVLMHSCLPDERYVANHFRLQAFFSEKSFPSLPVLFFSYNFVVFHIIVLARTVELHLGCCYRSISHVACGLPAGFFLEVGLLQYFDYFPL